MAARMMHHEGSPQQHRPQQHHQPMPRGYLPIMPAFFTSKYNLEYVQTQVWHSIRAPPSDTRACHSIRHHTSMPQHLPPALYVWHSMMACHSICHQPSQHERYYSYLLSLSTVSVYPEEEEPLGRLRPCAALCSNARSSVPVARKEASVDASSTASLAYCATVPARWQHLNMALWQHLNMSIVPCHMLQVLISALRCCPRLINTLTKACMRASIKYQ